MSVDPADAGVPQTTSMREDENAVSTTEEPDTEAGGSASVVADVERFTVARGDSLLSASIAATASTYADPLRSRSAVYATTLASVVVMRVSGAPGVAEAR